MTTRDKWDIKQSGVEENSCSCCGEVKPCIHAADPVVEKLRGNSMIESDMMNFCRPCWTERQDEANAQTTV